MSQVNVLLSFIFNSMRDYPFTVTDRKTPRAITEKLSIPICCSLASEMVSHGDVSDQFQELVDILFSVRIFS